MATKKQSTPISAPVPVAAPRGRKALTPAEKAAREEFLKSESKEDKLIRLANPRVTKAVKAIAAVGKLAAYKPSDAQIDKIEQALGETCAAVVMRLRGTRKESFTFNIS